MFTIQRCAPHHVNLALVHQDTNTEEKGEEEFVFFEQRPTDVAVQTEGEVVIDGHDSHLQIIW